MNGMQRLFAALLLVTGSIPAVLQAATINLFANADSSQEVPINATTGTGTAAITLDDVSHLLSWNISYSGLTGNATGMHFHGPAAVGVNTGIQVNIGTTSGLASPSIGSTTITHASELDLLQGLWYLNIHTANFPGGEIRGQIQVVPAVPVPAAAWLMMSGLMGMAGVSVRKRRAAISEKI